MVSKIELYPMSQWPDRDAAAYYAIDIYDHSGVRYPVRAMIEGLAFSLLPDSIRPDTHVVEELYRYELAALLEGGKLRRAGDGQLNVVFFAEEATQIREGDTVVWHAKDRILAAARRISVS